jgi:hypothetical protein
MTLVDTSRVMVVVVGRHPVVDGATLVREASSAGHDLRLLFVGYPLSPDQRVVEVAAFAEADRLGVYLDVQLILSVEALRAAVVPGDPVRVSAEPRETRRLERALRRR